MLAQALAAVGLLARIQRVDQEAQTLNPGAGVRLNEQRTNAAREATDIHSEPWGRRNQAGRYMTSYRTGEHLLPALMVIRRQLKQRKKHSAPELQSLYGDLDFLALNTERAFHSVIELARLQTLIEQNWLERAPSRTVALVPPELRNPMAFAVDSFLDAARRAQNGLLACVSRCLSISMRRSLADLVPKLVDGRVQLPEEIAQPTTAYWSRHGQKLKYYRDAAQHHMIVTSDARIYRSDLGIPVIHFVLINNPEIKNPGRFAYEEPFVHSFDYISNEFLALLEFCNIVSHTLAERDKDPGKGDLVFRFNVPVAFGPDGTVSAGEGRPIPDSGAFVDRVIELTRRTGKRADENRDSRL
jgi:hypothetical protein